MSESAGQLVEHFFRHEFANLTAVLSRAFGMHRVELVEDAVQAAMLEAVQVWPRRGLPENPGAWIHRAAKNRMLDALRREQVYQQAMARIGHAVEEQSAVVDQWLEEARVPDSLLRMMFVCCHPSLDRQSQIALTLKTLCGFSIAEVARGLLLSGETAKKRVQRARRKLATANVRLELPDVSQLNQRLHAVHETLYLLFNEGYSTSAREEPIHEDICEEAVRLTHLLCESACSSPATRALLALMLFHASRLKARTDETGAIILLEDQDRSKWDQSLICTATHWLAKSKTDQPARFHLEAAIAMQHCVAPSIQATNWNAIVELYTCLRQLRDSPVYALNQAIAIGQAGETSTAMSQLLMLKEARDMRNYLLLDCAIACIHELEGNDGQAISSYRDALTKNPAPHETALLEQKLRRLQMVERKAE